MTARMEKPPELPRLSRSQILSQLESRYLKKGLDAAWRAEKGGWTEILGAITSKPGGISFNYAIESVLGLGGAAAVFRVIDLNLFATLSPTDTRSTEERTATAFRALKVPRPHLEKGVLLAESLRDEISRLAALNHPHIVSLFAKGQIETALGGEQLTWPWYIMEYIPDATDLDELCRNDPPTIPALAQILYAAALGLEYIHANNVVHCDVKPANIFVSGSTEGGALGRSCLADFGYAKAYQPSSQTTRIGFTDHFAHPELLLGSSVASQASRTFTSLRRNLIRPAFDLFAFGMSIRYLLDSHYRRYAVYSKYSYEVKFLELCSARLLDGLNSRKEITYADVPYYAFRDTGDAARGTFSPGLKYHAASELVGDLEKLLGTRSIEVAIPELVETRRENIQVSDTAPVVYSERLRQLVDHPLVRRLASVTQLGLVSMVYPGATHSRLEHALGAFGVAARFLRSLYHDKLDPFFLQVIGAEKAKATLVAALLHDLGQYPLAHDLEDVSLRFFGHEGFGELLLQTGRPLRQQEPLFPELEKEAGDLARSLAHLLEELWGLSLPDVAGILRARSTEDARQRQVGSNVERLCKSLIDGPIDADKMDYLQRDARHCNVQYGYGIDFNRLTKCLTVARKSVGDDHLLLVMGVQEKGRISAESVAFVRYAMLTQVYWHHTMRSMKACLHHAAAEFLTKTKPNTFERKRDDFLRCAILEEPVAHEGWNRLIAGAEASNSIHWGDLRVLGWLWLNTTLSGRTAIEHILRRALYKRIMVLYRDELTEGERSTLEKSFAPENYADRCELRKVIEQALLTRLRSVPPPDALLETCGYTREEWQKHIEEHGRLRCLVDYPAPRSGAAFGLQVVRQWGERPPRESDRDHAPLESYPRLISVDHFNDGMKSLERSMACLRIYWEPAEFGVLRETLDDDSIRAVVRNEIKAFTTGRRGGEVS